MSAVALSPEYTIEAISEQFDGFVCNSQQIAAINAAVEWFRGWVARKHRRQVFFLAGYAGTGKTTIAKIIATLCCGMDLTMFIAPTGKAASRLRFKGCKNARTLHQFIYRPAGEDPETGEPIFTDKGTLQEDPLLVCMDEASMVGRFDRDKLLDRRKPVLALGDPGQVPPVKDAQVFYLDNADIVLDEIERNAGNIVRASMFVRNGKRLPVREYDDFKVSQGHYVDDKVFAQYLNDDGVVLCARNNTRQRMNRKARKILGHTGRLPNVGEKLVCLANQHEYGIMNGEQGIVIRFEEIPDSDFDADESPDMQYIVFRSLTDGRERRAKFNPACFTADSQDEIKEASRSAGGWDFGYALTIHKSQGSEWLRGLVFEESIPGVPYAQLMYTAITRFIEYVHFLRAD